MSRDDLKQDFLDAIEAAGRWHKRTPIEQVEFDRVAAGAFPGGPNLKPGDYVLHPKSSRWLVLKIEAPLVHLVAEDGSAIELSLDTTLFAPHYIERGERRIFSTAPKYPR